MWNINPYNPSADGNGYRYPIRQVYEVRENQEDGDFASSYFSTLSSEKCNSIHNIVTRSSGSDDIAYISYYTKGIRVLDASDPEDMSEIAYYDVPGVDTYVYPVFNGTWGVDPFLPSGTVLGSSSDGLYVFHKPGTFAGAIDVDTEWSGTIVVTSDVTVEDGATLTVAPGTTVKLENNADILIEDGAALVAEGTISNRITFTSADGSANPNDWGSIKTYYTNDNSLKWCTIEGADSGLYFDHGNGNVVENCTFQDNDEGITIYKSTVTVENSTITDNRRGIVITAQATVTPEDNDVTYQEEEGIVVTGSSTVDMFYNNVQNNGTGASGARHGLYIYSGGNTALGSRTFSTSSTAGGGYNTLANNDQAGARVLSGATLLAGESEWQFSQVYRAGQNALHSNGTYDVHNSGSLVQAELNWWGSGVSSSNCSAANTSGSVDVSNCLDESPINPLVAWREDEQPVAANNAGHASNTTGEDYLASSGESLDTEVKTALINQFKATVASSPDSTEAVVALRQYYALVRDDKSDKLQQRSTVAGYLNGVYQSNRNTPLGHAALDLRILDDWLTGDIESAISLSERALEEVTEDIAQGVLFNLVMLHLENGDLQSAKSTATAYRTKYPNDETGSEILDDLLKRTSDRAASQPTLAKQQLSAPPQAESHAATVMPFQAHPNPFNPTTHFRYTLPEAGEVEIRLFNALGQQIRLLEQASRSAGDYATEWDARNDAGVPVGSGIYFYRVVFRPDTKGRQVIVQSGKVTLLK